MASNRNFIIRQSYGSANKVITYEGTSGDVPWQLQGEYTTEAKAKAAIANYLLDKPDSTQEVIVEIPESTGEIRGNSKRKQRV